MKIAVIIPTRERPRILAGVIMALDHLSSGRHQIQYFVRCDSDSRRTAEVLSDLQLPNLTVIERDPPPTVGHKVNEAVAAAEGYDVYAQLCDDVFPLLLNWDFEIVGGAMKHKLFFWNDQTVPGAYSYPVMTRKYLKAVGQMWPEHFPFWFADQWIDETYELAFGQRAAIIDDLKIGGRRGGTIAARDFDFWFRFHAFLRPERVEQAKRVQAAFNLPVRDYPSIVARFEERDRTFYQSRMVLESCERIATDQRPPSESYLVCKRNAEALMMRRAA